VLNNKEQMCSQQAPDVFFLLLYRHADFSKLAASYETLHSTSQHNHNTHRIATRKGFPSPSSTKDRDFKPDGRVKGGQAHVLRQQYLVESVY
jgi:hypothetical protein